jgi:hypothetical protein
MNEAEKPVHSLTTAASVLTPAQRATIRLAAVRDAYWENTDPESREWANLHEALRSIGVANTTSAMCRALLDLLPANTIGHGISLRFDDCSVGDEISRFARNNKDFIHAVITAHMKQD